MLSVRLHRLVCSILQSQLIALHCECTSACQLVSSKPVSSHNALRCRYAEGKGTCRIDAHQSGCMLALIWAKACLEQSCKRWPKPDLRLCKCCCRRSTWGGCQW